MIKLFLFNFLLISFTNYGQNLYTFYLVKGQICLENGELDRALDYVNQGQIWFPDSIAFIVGKGYVLEKMNDLDGSLIQFNKAIQFDSTNYIGFVNRARNYELREQYLNACEDYKTAYYLGYLPALQIYNSGCGYIYDPNNKNPPPPVQEDIIIEQH